MDAVPSARGRHAAPAVTVATGGSRPRARRSGPGGRVCRSRRAGAVAAPGIVALLALAACGGGDGEAAPALPSASTAATASAVGTPSAEATGPVSDEDWDRAWDEYRACMADYGVEVEADDGQDEVYLPAEGDPGVSAEAIEECQPILEETLGSFDLSPQEEADLRERELAYARCMRENGFPDFPDPSTGAGAQTLPPGIDPASPEFDEATELCVEEAYGDLDGTGVDGEAEGTGS